MNESRTSWHDAVNRWLGETLSKSPKVVANERFVLNALGQTFGNQTIQTIDARAILQHCRARLDAGRKPRTVNRDLRVLRAVLRAAHFRGDLLQMPRIAMIRVTTKRLRWITYQQSQHLMQHLPPHQVAPVSFALETGLRKTNVAQLTWDQVDLRNALVWIHPDQAKARKAIAVPLTQTAINVLRSQIDMHPRHVFTYRGRPVKELNTAWFRNACRAAGIDNFTWHDLRRTWASRHAQNSTPPRILQELGGWSDPASVNIYTHLNVEHLRAHVATNHKRVRD